MKHNHRKQQPRDWQGFEYAHDTYQHVLRQQHSYKALKQQMASSTIPPQEIVIQQQSSRKLSESDQSEFQKAQLQNTRLVEWRDTSFKVSLPKKKQQLSRVYPQIRIIKTGCDLIDYGKLVYKSVLPGYSDKLFNHLQDINFQQPLNKEMHIKDYSFSSKFQCGNLACAYRMSENEYNLHMRADTNTLGHRQWYYFSVKNKRIGAVTFNIYYFLKPLSLYQKGMKPYVLSKKALQENPQLSWMQKGNKIKYKPVQTDGTKKTYFLSFEYEFQFQNDEVFFAACPPYSYTQMNRQLQIFGLNTKCKFQIQTLTKSVCGLDVPLVTISSDTQSSLTKDYVVMIARTHPGESSSSWVMDGLLQYYSTLQPIDKKFPQQLVLKIIPMMNVDGVFLGNYRTGIVGKDFNRMFSTTKSNLFPEIEAVRNLIQKLKESGKVLCFIDLHGHSILRNSFIFGSSKTPNDNRFSQLKDELAKDSKYFREQSCRFKNDSEKMQTARMYCQNKQNILSFTIQNSLGLYKNLDYTYPMRPADWQSFGNSLGKSILNLYMKRCQESPKHLYYHHSSFSQRISQVIQQNLNLYKDIGSNQTSDTSKSIINNTRTQVASPKFVSRMKSTGRHRRTESCRSEVSTEKNIIHLKSMVAKVQISTQNGSRVERRIAQSTKNRETLNIQKILEAAVEVKLEAQPPNPEQDKSGKNSPEQAHSANGLDEDLNDSDSQAQDLPQQAWNALAKQVQDVIEKQIKSQAKKVTSTYYEIAQSNKETVSTTKQLIKKVIKKRVEPLKPNGFRQVKFTMTKVSPNRGRGIEVLSLERQQSDNTRLGKVAKTQPSIILADRYLTEQISAFKGSKLVMNPSLTIENAKTSIFNQRHILDRMKTNITYATPLGKYFNKRK